MKPPLLARERNIAVHGAPSLLVDLLLYGFDLYDGQGCEHYTIVTISLST